MASALLFVASAAGTVYWCRSMSGGMPMPGGWTMSMAWMRMPGESWPVAAASFMGMWLVMMIAMMLPSLTLTLSRYSGATATAGAGYFFVWILFGAAVYPVGVALATAEMRWPALARSVPLAVGGAFVLAGCLQLTAWKARQLVGCRDAIDCYGNAWRHGLRLGLRCCLCCFGFMMILLVSGVMDLIAMAVVTIAITIERLGPWPERVARAAGVVVIAAGALIIGQALARWS
jgi:predicted metal-binding membrane protein